MAVSQTRWSLRWSLRCHREDCRFGKWHVFRLEKTTTKKGTVATWEVASWVWFGHPSISFFHMLGRLIPSDSYFSEGRPNQQPVSLVAAKIYPVDDQALAGSCRGSTHLFMFDLPRLPWGQPKSGPWSTIEKNSLEGPIFRTYEVLSNLKYIKYTWDEYMIFLAKKKHISPSYFSLPGSRFSSFQFDGVLGLGLPSLSQTMEFNFLEVDTSTLWYTNSLRTWTCPLK